MATIYRRKSKDGTRVLGWKAVVRIKGYPTVCEVFDRKQEADDWAQQVERQIKMGQFKFDRLKTLHTFDDLLTRYKSSGALEHHKAAEDTLRHLEYWKGQFASYALIHITPELIAKERQLLLKTPTEKGKARSPSTVNRYIAALSSLLSYASRELRWIDDNPCFNLIKLKEPAGRDRILTDEEMGRLLTAGQESRSPYLFPIILLALTTGMRQGEILGLKWNDIDLENRVAHIRDTKNSSPRSVPLVDSILDELKRLYEKRQPHKDYVFASHTTFGQIDIKKIWQTALKNLHINNLRFHDLRHTFATLAAKQGASNLELATAMGHKTLQILKRYTHMEAETTRKYSIGITQMFVLGEVK